MAVHTTSQLDARLAVGEDQAGDPAMTRRSTRLVSRRVRRRIAAGLERACRAAGRPAAFSAAAPVDPGAVEVARPALLQLAAALRRRESVRSQGVALAQALLTEPDSPLYKPEHCERLYEAAREALLALGPDRATIPVTRSPDRREGSSALPARGLS